MNQNYIGGLSGRCSPFLQTAVQSSVRVGDDSLEIIQKCDRKSLLEKYMSAVSEINRYH